MSKGKIKIKSIGDLHCPHHDSEIVKEFVKLKADVAVIVGDTLDLSSASKFRTRCSTNGGDDYEAAREIVLKICKGVKKCYIVYGNHDDRAEKLLEARIPGGASFLGHTSILHSMRDGLVYDGQERGLVGGHRIANLVVADPPARWLTLLGPVAFAHPSAHSKILARTGTTLVDWLLDRERAIGVRVEAAVLGHTHRQSMAMHKGVMMLEQGAACGAQQYEEHPKLSFGIQYNGFSLITIDGGHVDHDNTRIFHRGQRSIMSEKKCHAI